MNFPTAPPRVVIDETVATMVASEEELPFTVSAALAPSEAAKGNRMMGRLTAKTLQK